MTTRTFLLATMTTVALSTPGQAQQPGLAPAREPLAPRYVDAVRGLGLESAIAQALEHEPSLRAARSDVAVARGMRTQADLRPNPTMSFSQQEEPAGMDNQTRVELMWPLDLFRKTGRVAVADRDIDAARHDALDRERLLIAEVRVKYGEVAAAVRELTTLDELFAASSRQHELISARVDSGATPPLERDIIRVELRRLEAERLLQAGSVERLMVELKRLLGTSSEGSLTIRDTLEEIVRREMAVTLTVDRAVDARPDIAAAQSRVGVADAQVEAARSEGRFDVNLFGMYMRMNAGFPQRGFTQSGALEPVRSQFHYLAAGAAVTVPLRDRNQGGIAAAEARRIGASARLDAARLTAQAEVAAARLRDAHARRALAVYTSDTRALAMQNLTVIGQTYELGRATVFEVLAEQRRFLEVERAFTDTLREVYEARQALRLALGELR